MKLKLGVDVGGTFTDIVGIDEAGHVYFAKTPSTPQDQSIGVVNGIKRMIQDLNCAPGDVTAIAHGTTVATNTLLEKNGAITALITTEGFRDVLHIGRQSRAQLYDLHARRTEALIPRALRCEAKERTLYTGEVLLEVDEEDLKATVRRLVDEGVQSVAVCLLHSYANDHNERRVAQIIHSIAPDMPVSVSSDILPEFREFERMNTTVLNAYIQPRMDNYIMRLLTHIHEAGVEAPLTIMQSSGGMMIDKVAAEKSVNTLLSGPAGGVLAAAFLAGITEYHNIITGDLGGTSFDVSIVQDGKIGIGNEGVIEGYPVKFPHIDITTIGAGGGSIAWIDGGGALRVGPRSAGAVPGPVCYQRGGTEPTVTDAHAVLGRVGGELLAGEMKLDVEAARAAIREKLAEPLHMTVEKAAEGILRVANANMVRAIRVMTVERGIDPRKFVIMPFGGAGALHAVELARSLQIATVVVPVAPGNFSAFGLLAAPVRYDEVASVRLSQAEILPDKIEQVVQKLEAQAHAEMERDGIAKDAVTFNRSADVRYRGQAYELSIPLTGGAVDAQAVAQLLADFHAQHERTYGFQKPEDPVELINLRLAVVGNSDNTRLYRQSEMTTGTATPINVRKAYFGGEWLKTSVFNRTLLKAGQTFTGPAIIEEQGATTMIGPGDSARVDDRFNIVITVADTRTYGQCVDAMKERG